MLERRRRVLKVLVPLVTLALGLLVSELGYRLHLHVKLTTVKTRDLTYRVAPLVYVQYDQAFGERFKPSSQVWCTYVSHGRVVFGTTASRSNKDGLGGRTTLDDYARAELKVLVFGDSFSHWNQGGASWPDLLQAALAQRTGKRVAVLDFARGAYGVLQMLDLAAAEVPALKPDAVVIAAIGDDFTRDRWWCKEVATPSGPRWMMSSRSDEFGDYRFAIDELIVDPRATPEWCDRMLASGGAASPEDAEVLAEVNARFAAIRREALPIRKGFELFGLRSYLWTKLWTGSPYPGALGRGDSPIPQVATDDFGTDRRLLEDVARLRAAGTPLILAYLPLAEELRAGRAIVGEKTERLMRSLEQLAGSRIRFALLAGEPVPDHMDLLPFDLHPSRAGLEYYARAVAEMCSTPR